MTDEIKYIRKTIDTLDNEITERLIQRLQASSRIGELKQGEGLTYHDPKREEEIIARVLSQVDDQRLERHIRAVFEKILDESKNYQHG